MIALVLDPFGEARQSGLGRAAYELTRAMIAAAPEERFVVVLKREPKNRPDLGVEVRTTSGGMLWLDEAVRKSAEADVHVFFTPVYPLFARPKKSVVVVHDFAYRVFESPWRRMLLTFLQRRALCHATKIVAVSEATKKEAAKLSGRSDITVIYNGVNALPESSAKEGSYFLLGGGIKARKNTLPALEAYARFVERGGKEELWVLGTPVGEYGTRVKTFVEQHRLSSRVKFIPYCTDQELSALYRGARAFIFPSAVEGFGMMAIEAIVAGAPVIYANTPVLREVLGEGGLPIDPHNVQTFAKALHDLSTNDALRQELIKKGKEHIKRYSWELASKQFATLLKTL